MERRWSKLKLGRKRVWGGTLISSPRLHHSFWSFSLNDDALLNGAHLSWGVTLRKIVTVKPRAFTIENCFFFVFKRKMF